MLEHSRIVEATSRMPFVGKFVVAPCYYNGSKACEEGRSGKKFMYAGCIGLLALGHVPQAMVGYSELTHNFGHSESKAAIDALYFTANAAVIYTQAFLSLKLATKPVAEVAPQVETEDTDSESESFVYDWATEPEEFVLPDMQEDQVQDAVATEADKAASRKYAIDYATAFTFTLGCQAVFGIFGR